jgi:hypothetical protein
MESIINFPINVCRVAAHHKIFHVKAESVQEALEQQKMAEIQSIDSEVLRLTWGPENSTLTVSSFLFDMREELHVDDVLKVTFPVRRVVCDSKSTVLQASCPISLSLNQCTLSSGFPTPTPYPPSYPRHPTDYQIVKNSTPGSWMKLGLSRTTVK